MIKKTEEQDNFLDMGQQTSVKEGGATKDNMELSGTRSGSKYKWYHRTVMNMNSMNSIREANVVLRQHTNPQVQQGGSVTALFSMQTSEGFWPWRDELLSCMGLIPTIVAATMEIQDIKSHSATIAATAVAIRYFKSITREGDNPWDIHTSQASCWLAGQAEPSQLASLLDQADDLF
ncbi:hypothetical protein BCR41DRAFT_400150 [Lobosporangium transversale]|uniref:Uncharacterized protein n=1 Tax=Lobosporangium transversale TaxID=64571 RepID=A0A1Y2GBI1_9FUNG|nr:hypothetical protein BCR41DRAFT_400150 [Lobosporangium transversale]ORZ06311.1 hypothetical protein BCR41DRAFT_400150 [Lobosporangium transversale]|eukprot:XP_021877474.1 hypothetical protein BCR41DRAFT_400150 [Lobosporangium transversale]